ncbi:uncharacterized protein LOC142336252 [Convolutriloba macropyga]|uniref:uncharacterized protein LOC142336252 n=1 Tax=Convolutriloba macropyga TaxID=536237 RepID=UPI003F526A28
MENGSRKENEGSVKGTSSAEKDPTVASNRSKGRSNNITIAPSRSAPPKTQTPAPTPRPPTSAKRAAAEDSNVVGSQADQKQSATILTAGSTLPRNKPQSTARTTSRERPVSEERPIQERYVTLIINCVSLQLSMFH